MASDVDFRWRRDRCKSSRVFSANGYLCIGGNWWRAEVGWCRRPRPITSQIAQRLADWHRATEDSGPPRDLWPAVAACLHSDANHSETKPPSFSEQAGSVTANVLSVN